MATLDLGKIKQVWRGTYNNGTAYVVDDLVAYTDSGITSTYICVANSTGNAPSSSGTAHASWNYVAKGVADPIPSQSGNAGKFLKTDGSSLSYASAGITMHDNWHVNAGYTFPHGENTITANWARSTGDDFGNIGSAMTESSGVFTFPSTGIYYIQMRGFYYTNTTNGHFKYTGFNIRTSTDGGSSSSARASCYSRLRWIESSTYKSNYVDYTFDVTNTSTHKILISSESFNTSITAGDRDGRRFALSFTKLGET